MEFLNLPHSGAHMIFEPIAISNKLFSEPIAHRGYHDCGGSFGVGRTENSMSAFEAAIQKGFGIELDVQLTADNIPVVFHDSHLQRLTGKNKYIRELKFSDLQNIKLFNGETIPTFSAFLNLISGSVPILIELKDQDGGLGENVGSLETQVAKALEPYQGPAAIMSYNPNSMISVARKLPEIPRGLVTEPFSPKFWPRVRKERLDDLRAHKYLKKVQASFISHYHRDLNSKHVERVSRFVSVLSWTIRNTVDMKLALKKSKNITFEGFNPRDY